jgi:hypothetical protein
MACQRLGPARGAGLAFGGLTNRRRGTFVPVEVVHVNTRGEKLRSMARSVMLDLVHWFGTISGAGDWRERGALPEPSRVSWPPPRCCLWRVRALQRCALTRPRRISPAPFACIPPRRLALLGRSSSDALRSRLGLRDPIAPHRSIISKTAFVHLSLLHCGKTIKSTPLGSTCHAGPRLRKRSTGRRKLAGGRFDERVILKVSGGRRTVSGTIQVMKD